jgi:hypothetical protein
LFQPPSPAFFLCNRNIQAMITYLILFSPVTAVGFREKHHITFLYPQKRRFAASFCLFLASQVASFRFFFYNESVCVFWTHCIANSSLTQPGGGDRPHCTCLLAPMWSTTSKTPLFGCFSAASLRHCVFFSAKNPALFSGHIA